jgi:hypothetical protein
VIWKDKLKNIVLTEHDVTAEKYWIESDNERIIVDEMSLPRGDFVVIVKTLSDNPQFDGTFKTGLVAGQKYVGAEIPAKGSTRPH